MDRIRAYGIFPIAVIVGVIYLVFQGAPGRTEAAGPSAGQVSQVEAGRNLYLSSCAACHGPAGGGTDLGPSLADSGAAAADFMLRTGRMPFNPPGDPTRGGTPAFSEADIQALDAFVGSLGRGPSVPDVVTSAADIPTGRALYNADCAQCHGPSGAGDAIGGGAIAPSLLRSDPTTVVEAMRVGPNVMPVFPSGGLDDRAAAAIAAYVRFLQHAPSPGGVQPPLIGPVAEGFVAVVVGLGSLILISRVIVPRRRAAARTSRQGRPDDASDGNDAGPDSPQRAG